MKQTIHWGIIGTGRIAAKFASDLMHVKEAVLSAVGSRNAITGEAFAKNFNIPKHYESYEALVADPLVDVIYIASPHTFHYEHTLLCLQHGKAVLCEKPFAMNLAQTQAMVALAKEKKVFLMEALWTKFLPHYRTAKTLVAEGKIGEVRAVTANFGFLPQAPINPRLFDPALGGGTILDIGIYNIFIAMSFLGTPDTIQALMTPAPTGVDAQCNIAFSYANGAMASLFSSFETSLDVAATINGTTGRLTLTNRFYEPSSTIEYTDFSTFKTEQLPMPEKIGFGYHYEASHVTECLLKGMTESDIMTFDDSIALMTVLDEVRSKAGVRYAEDV